MRQAQQSSPAGYQAVLRRGNWFSSLPDEVALRLMSRAMVLRLSGRQQLFARGDAFCGIYCVLEGVVRLSALNQDGRESIMGFTEVSQWFGEISLFDRLPRSVWAVAEEPTSVLHLPATEIDQLLRDDPSLALHFGTLLAGKLRVLMLSVESLALLPRNARMARHLLMIASQHWSVKPEFVRRRVPFQHEQIALLMQITRQTVGLALKDLEAEGVIRRQYGHVEILDWARLTRLAGLSGAAELDLSALDSTSAKTSPFLGGPGRGG